MYSTWRARALPRAGCPIQKSPDHRLLPTPRRLSQVAASFFGSKEEDPEIEIAFGILEISIDLFGCQCAGGDERIRTADPLLAKQVLSQLSYIPWGALFAL